MVPDQLVTKIGEFLSEWEQMNAIFVDGMEYVPVTVVDALASAMCFIAGYLQAYVLGCFAFGIVAFWLCTVLYRIIKNCCNRNHQS